MAAPLQTSLGRGKLSTLLDVSASMCWQVHSRSTRLVCVWVDHKVYVRQTIHRVLSTWLGSTVEVDRLRLHVRGTVLSLSEELSSSERARGVLLCGRRWWWYSMRRCWCWCSPSGIQLSSESFLLFLISLSLFSFSLQRRLHVLQTFLEMIAIFAGTHSQRLCITTSHHRLYHRALHGLKISSPARPEKGSAQPITLQKNTGPARSCSRLIVIII